MLNKLEKPKTLKETALEQLRTAIMLGQISPGDRLVERTIGEQLGVSRTVVRECIRHLESEHLVTTISGKGPIVAILEPDEIQQIYRLRMMLESEAVKNCTKKADNSVITTLRQLVIEIANELQQKEVVNALHSTRQFYELIFLTGGMSVAWELVERLNGRIGRLRVMTLSTPGREKDGPSNLHNITESIAIGDAEAAVAACQKHIEEAYQIGLTLIDTSENKITQ